jgi:hypothetical protein
LSVSGKPEKEHAAKTSRAKGKHDKPGDFRNPDKRVCSLDLSGAAALLGGKLFSCDLKHDVLLVVFRTAL